MKLIIVRHGDPDYVHDSLTEEGWREAEALSDYLAQTTADEYYVSPLGRARDTASLTLKKLRREEVILPWLREFTYPCKKPNDKGSEDIAWDWYPSDWTGKESFFKADEWYNEREMKEAGIKAHYDEVCTSLDKFLSAHGYEREGKMYRARESNTKTIVFFCHFGVESVLLSHLMNTSPMVIWHSFCALPSSFTTIVTEEREKGCAYFRMTGFGELAHLYMKGIKPSSAALFEEVQ